MLQAAVSRVLSRYATFSGRAARAEFWWWTLAYYIVLIALTVIDLTVINPAFGLVPVGNTEPPQILTLIAALALLLPNLGVAVRRLHDTGRSGWWLLIVLVPIVGALVLIYFYVSKGDAGANAFGAPDPLPA